LARHRLRLALVPELAERVRRAIRWQAPDLLLVVDPAPADDPEDAIAAQAACLAAEQASLPVLARSLPAASGGLMIDLAPTLPRPTPSSAPRPERTPASPQPGRRRFAAWTCWAARGACAG